MCVGGRLGWPTCWVWVGCNGVGKRPVYGVGLARHYGLRQGHSTHSKHSGCIFLPHQGHSDKKRVVVIGFTAPTILQDKHSHRGKSGLVLSAPLLVCVLLETTFDTQP